jgi:hypothetical protein
MYSREIFMGIKGYLIFCLALAKDFLFAMYHFAIKATPTFQAGVIITFLTQGEKPVQIFENIWLDRLVKAVRCVAELLEFPKKVLATFHWTIDGGYRDFSGDQKKKHIHMFCCDTMLHLENVPSTFANGMEDGADAKKWWSTDEKNDCFDQQQIDEVMGSVRNEKKGSGIVKACDPWRIQFYEHMCIRINGIIFTRYLTRIIIKFASSLCYLITGLLIRSSPSSQILNMVIDHSGAMPTRMLVFGLLFLCLDTCECAIVMYIQMAEERRRQYNFRRFARFFDSSKAFLIMITLCHICCNSDVFLTFSSLKFCDKALL